MRLAIKTGTYEKNGETKGRYANIGVMKDSGNGPYLLLDPTVDLGGCFALQQKMNGKGDSVMVSMFEEGQSAKKPEAQKNATNDKVNFDDDIPFS